MNFSILPIEAHKEEIIDKIESNDVLILVGETGCGKSTKIPQYIYEAHKKTLGVHPNSHHRDDNRGDVIGITQPRRIAAITLARRVAKEMGAGKVGTLVGYSVRFDECYHSVNTKIKYLTDGMLLKEYLGDNALSKYGWICLDEAHERTLRTDILFGLLKRLASDRRTRPLKLVIMSATIDSEAFVKYFSSENCKSSLINIHGRQYPTRIYYTQTAHSEYLEATLITIFQIHKEHPLPGDILVFLTGQEEIEYVYRILCEHKESILALPLYAALTPQQQSKAFDPSPSGVRKIILATNIAETSVTIPNVRYVIDTGMVKMRMYHPEDGFESLTVVPISRASAKQRCGRAGREFPGGACYRLYTESTYTNSLQEVTIPEMKRSNLEHVILMMKASGIDNVLQFDYLDPPPLYLLSNALEELLLLGALDKEGSLTPLGYSMAKFPLEPKLSKTLIKAHQRNCLRDMLTIVSFLSTENLFMVPETDENSSKAQHPVLFFSDPSGDFITLLNMYKAYKRDSSSPHFSSWLERYQIHSLSFNYACKVFKQLEQHCIQAGLSPIYDSPQVDTEAILRCMLDGFFRQLAVLQPDKQTYKTVAHGHIVHIHPSSVLFHKKSSQLPDLVIYHELVLTSKCYMKGISRIEQGWIHELISERHRRT